VVKRTVGIVLAFQEEQALTFRLNGYPCD
jgi:hypothetical protein